MAAAHEDTYHCDSHRQADAGRAGYLWHLVGLGYTPAESDRLVIGEQTFPEAADSEPAAGPEPVTA